MSVDGPKDSFAALFETEPRAASPRRVRVGELLGAVVVQVGRDAVFVELEGRRQALVEAADVRGPDGSIKVAAGHRMLVRVVQVDTESGIRVVPTVDSAVAVGAAVSLGAGQEAGADAVKIAVGQLVSAVVDRVESYGIFLQIDGTKGRTGRGLAPVAELGVARGTDLRKAFPLGTKMRVKVVDMTEGKIRLSVRALKDDEERAHFEGFREKEKASSVPVSGFGTLGDLLKNRKA